ncbi:MAG: sensor histidine kinase [Rhodoglobus sp.]
MLRSLTRVQLIVDISIAALCLLLRLTFGFESVALVVVVVIMAGSLAIRRLSPAIALGAAWVGAIIQLIALQAPDVSNLAILAVLYTTARYGARWVKWAGLISAGVGSVLAALYMTFMVWNAPSIAVSDGKVVSIVAPASFQTGFTFAAWLVGMLAALGLSWTLGLLAKTWREARDAQLAKVLAQENVVIEQERNRIARDMHDVVAHSLAVVIAQADGARYARTTDPEAVDAALITIASTAREALGDVRGLLGQLRHSQAEGPQPAIADLSVLLDQLRASGLDVRLEQRGAVHPLPASQQLAVYRITQEGLTNALRHGNAATPVFLTLDWQGDRVALSLVNQLRGGALPETRIGHGTMGMRERAVLAGGSFTGGIRDAHYVVEATVPFSREVSS